MTSTQTTSPGYDRDMQEGASSRRSWPGASVVDLVLGLVLSGLGLVITLAPDAGVADHRLLASVVIPACTLPVIWRRRAPVAAAAAFAIGVVISAVPTFDQVRCGVAIPAGLLIVYACGSRLDRRQSIQGLFLTFVGLGVLSFTDPNLDLPTAPFLLALSTGVWGSGRVIASRNRAAAELADRTRELERQREDTARLAVAVERTNLATDLDGAARGRISDVMELSERGEQELAADPEAARAAFAQIEQDGRASLNEMRGLLGVLRSDERGTRTPRPTLAELDRLLESARVGGRVVELSVDGERRQLPDALELAAYRIVQHALEAFDEGPANVSLQYDPDALVLEVSGGHADGEAGAEQAVVAAREQASARGGSFSVSTPSPLRRTLQARLPVTT